VPTASRAQQPSGPDAFLRAVRSAGRSLKDRYRDDPVGLAERLGLKLPRKPVLVMEELGIYDPEKHGPITPGLRELVEDVCLLRVESAAAVANRGGGKSQGVSFIEFFLWMLRDFDALNLGGSELQADNVYQYLLGYLDTDAEWQRLVKGEPMKEKTTSVEHAWVRVLTASQKSVRSPHAGGFRKGKWRGGLLVIDEEAETEKDIVEAALPTINTATPSVNVRCSTFHNIEGSFADLVRDHVEMGYKLYQWDIFDVCAGCECGGGGCESPEPCFREDHFEEYVDPDDGEIKKRLLHRAYCGGRAKYAEGWIPMAEIEKLWKRLKRNHAKWEVEAMGQRPSTKGHVIKDLKKFSENITLDSGDQLYLPGAPISICVDWGTAAAGVEVWQEQPGDKHALIYCEQLEEAGQTEIIGEIVSLASRFRRELSEIAADIGGGGNYLNPLLRDHHRLPVRDVDFQTEKEAAVAAWNIFNEAGATLIPSEFQLFKEQVENWKRKNGRIAKGNDHLCDTAVCYFSKFAERLGTNHLRVPARSFSSGRSAPEQPRSPTDLRQPSQPISRLPVRASIRTFGNSKKNRRR